MLFPHFRAFFWSVCSLVTLFVVNLMCVCCVFLGPSQQTEYFSLLGSGGPSGWRTAMPQKTKEKLCSL